MTAIETYEEVLADLRQRAGCRETALVSYTMAGVQDFIGCARTTRDVWNGSYLLSFLSWAATERMLEALHQQTGRTREEAAKLCLIPDLTGQPLAREWTRQDEPTADELAIANFPNSVRLLVPEDAAETIAGVAKDGAHDAWRAIRGACKEAFQSHLTGAAEAQWDYQTDPERIFEIYTSVYPVPPAAAGDMDNPYGWLMDQAQKRMGQCKRLRDVRQMGQEGLRCSLCGARSALADYDTAGRQPRPGRDLKPSQRSSITRFTYGRLRDYWGAVQEVEEFGYLFRATDMLCAVCTVRRLAPRSYFREFIGRKIDFPSTATIAVAQEMAGLLKWAEDEPAALRPLEEFLSGLNNGLRSLGIRNARVTLPDAMLPYYRQFPKYLHEFGACEGDWLYEESTDGSVLANQYGRATAGLPPPIRKLRRDLKHEFRPDDHFAVIAVDGDHMGNHFAGRINPGIYSPDRQVALSGRLAQFARQARRIIEDSLPGKLVYAGGDDVLAFVPRARALEAIHLLQQAFHGAVSALKPPGEPPTISVACIFAKHDEPLSGLIRTAETFLNEIAKECYGRNAFVLHRPAAGLTAGCRFDSGGLQQLIALCEEMKRKDGLSPGIVDALEEGGAGLAGWPEGADLEGARRKWIERAASRHCARRCEETVSKLLLTLLAALEDWRGDHAFAMLIDLLTIVRFLARHKS
jgi:CRISPR-associated protein Cmr2